MSPHCTITTELRRQRQAQVPADAVACHRIRATRQHCCWEHGFLPTGPFAPTIRHRSAGVRATA